MTFIFFDACREDLDTDEHKNLFENAIQDHDLFKYAPDRLTPDFPGYSAIFYSCKEWQKSAEVFNNDLPYNKQPMGHTPNALNLFKAFETGCRSYTDF
jgi:hypothetical protein